MGYYKWPFSIAMLNYQTVYHDMILVLSVFGPISVSGFEVVESCFGGFTNEQNVGLTMSHCIHNLFQLE